MIRRLDDLGRVVIPRFLRQLLGWKCDDELVITRKGNKVVLEKQQTKR